jgi:formylmethanofuran dehydrogenase subunit A
MKKFKVGYRYTEAGTIIIEAENNALAHKLVHDEMEEHGLERFGQIEAYDTAHRDYAVEEVEEVQP